MQQIIKQGGPSRQLFQTVNFAFMKIFDFLIKTALFGAFLLFYKVSVFSEGHKSRISNKIDSEPLKHALSSCKGPVESNFNFISIPLSVLWKWHVLEKVDNKAIWKKSASVSFLLTHGLFSKEYYKSKFSR